jgi:hypothetical protein
MRFIVAIAVTAVGIGCYAAAALLFDRRRHIAQWMIERHSRGRRSPVPAGRTRAAGPPAGSGGPPRSGRVPGAGGALGVGGALGAGRSTAVRSAAASLTWAGSAAAIRTATAVSPHNPVLLPILGCLALGTLLIFGSCVGLIAF